MDLDVSSLPQLVRNAGRLNEIVSVLAKYGLAPWLVNVKADWLQRLLRSDDGQQIGEQPQAVRVRLALTELGTTFIKFGQILSTRVDLVGPELADELAKLQSGTAADEPAIAVATVEAGLGSSVGQLFRDFNENAFASASIGQVHNATLHNGTRVVVKVRHSGIEEAVRNDLEIMVELARAVEVYAPHLRSYQPLATATEFKKTLENELDFTLEQRNLIRFARNFADDAGVRIPTAFSDLCSQHVLTMDRLDGLTLSNREKLVEAGFDLTEVARAGANMFLQMVFRDGFYHADPHPGNLMVLDGQVIGVLDCGMVGRVDDELREQFEDMLLAAIDKDPDRLLDSVIRMGELPPDFDRRDLKDDLITFVDDYGEQSLENFDLSGALNEMTAIIRRHQIILPSRVALLLKMLVMLEGTSKQLSPDFSLAELLEPYRAEAIKKRLSPARLWRKLQTAQRDWGRLVESLPSDVSDIMNRVRRGSFEVNLEHRRLDSIVNRLVMGVLTAALFVGSASLWSNNVKPLIWDTSVPGALGCTIAVYLGFHLIRAVKKSGNLRGPS